MRESNDRVDGPLLARQRVCDSVTVDTQEVGKRGENNRWTDEEEGETRGQVKCYRVVELKHCLRQDC